MRRSIHSSRLERWLTKEKIANLQASVRGWYGRPILLLDVPGSVRITKDGDFVGEFYRGHFASALDVLAELWTRLGKQPYGFVGAGFSSISEVLQRASQGHSQRFTFSKVGTTSAAGFSTSLWNVGTFPAAGTAGAAAPEGTANSSSTTGAIPFANPASGTMHLVGADVLANVVNNQLLMYDRIFSVAKTASSTGTEAVTGVPTRYQSSTATDADFAGDNFLFMEVVSALGATAHNWTVCQYTDEAGNTGATLPSVTGIASAAANRLDLASGLWFAPLATGNIGVKALTQMQCSASVTGTLQFVMGHPLGFMAFPIAAVVFPFDWITNRDQVPRIFDSACIAFLEVVKPSTTATTYAGRIAMTSAAP